MDGSHPSLSAENIDKSDKILKYNLFIVSVSRFFIRRHEIRHSRTWLDGNGLSGFFLGLVKVPKLMSLKKENKIWLFKYCSRTYCGFIFYLSFLWVYWTSVYTKFQTSNIFLFNLNNHAMEINKANFYWSDVI